MIDSQYNFGIYHGPLPSQAAYHYLRYDNPNRILQDSTVYNYYHLPANVQNYAYDQHGNLAGTSKMYDNKLNPRRANAIWMFIDRNYSLNNTTGQPCHYKLI